MSQENNILKELTGLNSSLAGSMPGHPYEVPQGYFEGLANEVLNRIRNGEGENAAEETAKISPLLAGLKKEMPYAVPDGYFERPISAAKNEAKLVSMNPRKWFRYVAAVVVVGLVGLTVMITVRNNDMDRIPLEPFVKKLDKEIGRMADTDLREFIELTNPVLIADASVKTQGNDEIRELLEDIPVSELKAFIEETSVIDAEEVLMN